MDIRIGSPGRNNYWFLFLWMASFLLLRLARAEASKNGVEYTEVVKENQSNGELDISTLTFASARREKEANHLNKRRQLVSWLQSVQTMFSGDKKKDDVNSDSTIKAIRVTPAPTPQPPPTLVSQLSTLLQILSLPPDALVHLNDITPQQILPGLKAAMPPKNIQLGLKQSPLAVDETTSLTLMEIKDNRCPPNVNCITSSSSIFLAVEQKNNPRKSFVRLSLGGKQVEIDGGYTLAFTQLDPPPVEPDVTRGVQEIRPEEYVVTLEVYLPVERMLGFVTGMLKWGRSNGIVRGYSFSERRSCFCLPDTTRSITMVVSPFSSTITASYNDEQGGVVSAQSLQAYKTIEDLFGLIGNAYLTNAEVLEVTYDPALGYPTSVYIDQSKMIADDEFTYEAYAVKISPTALQ